MIPETLMALGAFLALAFSAVILVPYAYAKGCSRWLAAKCRRAKAIVLTYDDGPGERLTPALMELLQRQHAKATFFALGRQAELRPGVLDQLLENGHEVGCHGYGHCHAWKVPPMVAMADITRGFASLERWLPAAAAMFRPPHGKLTLFTWLAVRRRKARLMWWTHDSGDTCAAELPAVDVVAARVVQSGGGVVLIHDFDRQGGSSTPSRHEYVLQVTECLIERARQAGFAIMTLGELLALGRTQPAPAMQAKAESSRC